ncbi:hypothetical protein BJY18_005495 [Amycolatopsis jiangsuensis]|uniref:DUF2530 domain-containing protein n=1 Tax=Amycolatopsis jiangsuensis TaxID=1181879 RepID=A0A840J1S5_9PSEU|nr:hypothetical protein [Amycolatopsis jiangsuensis]
MDEPTDAPDVTGSLRHTPELPKRLTDLTPVVIVGTTLWLVALVVLFFFTHGVWVQTALAGVVLGLIGFGIIFWQRAAARRGSRSAQRL